MNTLEKFEKEHLKDLESDKKLPTFNSGDTLKVHLKVKELPHLITFRYVQQLIWQKKDFSTS